MSKKRQLSQSQGFCCPLRQDAPLLLPHLVMKTSSITPLTGPWDVGQATLWGWSLWKDIPLHPHPSPLESKERQGGKRLYIHHWQGIQGDSVKRHWCVLDRMDWIGSLHMVQGEVVGHYWHGLSQAICVLIDERHISGPFFYTIPPWCPLRQQYLYIIRTGSWNKERAVFNLHHFLSVP